MLKFPKIAMTVGCEYFDIFVILDDTFGFSEGDGEFCLCELCDRERIARKGWNVNNVVQRNDFTGGRFQSIPRD
jgi:hypothetical protein